MQWQLLPLGSSKTNPHYQSSGHVLTPGTCPSYRVCALIANVSPCRNYFSLHSSELPRVLATREILSGTTSSTDRRARRSIARSGLQIRAERDLVTRSASSTRLALKTLRSM